jgi:hypothetical protein
MPEHQGTRKSGCRISENQDIRKSENERALTPDDLISRYPLPESLII